MSRVGAVLGRAAGWMVAPVFAVTSRARNARTFHPRGETLHATVAVDPAVSTKHRTIAERLAGPALVRFSAALWKNLEALDVLGCAIRFRRSKRASAQPEADDQDLLFATIRRPWTMPFAPLTTDAHDYLGNHYFAVSPFFAGRTRRIYLRLRPIVASPKGSSRAERLAAALAEGSPKLHLEVANAPFGPWMPLARITLERIAAVDDEALRFRPFRTGRGLRPTGFVHALRRGVYALSQSARPQKTS